MAILSAAPSYQSGQSGDLIRALLSLSADVFKVRIQVWQHEDDMFEVRVHPWYWVRVTVEPFVMYVPARGFPTEDLVVSLALYIGGVVNLPKDAE